MIGWLNHDGVLLSTGIFWADWLVESCILIGCWNPPYWLATVILDTIRLVESCCFDWLVESCNLIGGETWYYKFPHPLLHSDIIINQILMEIMGKPCLLNGLIDFSKHKDMRNNCLLNQVKCQSSVRITLRIVLLCLVADVSEFSSCQMLARMLLTTFTTMFQSKNIHRNHNPKLLML